MSVFVIESLEVIEVIDEHSEPFGLAFPDGIEILIEGAHIQKSGLHVPVCSLDQISLKACASVGNQTEDYICHDRTKPDDYVSDQDITA